MPLDRQKGSDADWLQHSNAELAQMIQARDRRIRWLRMVCVILVLALIWVIFKYTRKGTIEELWQF